PPPTSTLFPYTTLFRSDLVGNSGNFVETTPLIWSGCPSPFHAFMDWSQWLYNRIGRTDGIALMRLMELLFEFLTQDLGIDPEQRSEEHTSELQSRFDLV